MTDSPYPPRSEFLHYECGLPWVDHEYKLGKGKKLERICPDDPAIYDQMHPDPLDARPTGKPERDEEDRLWDAIDDEGRPPWLEPPD